MGTTYEEAVKAASVFLTPLQDALRAHGIDSEIEQTGGFCMVLVARDVRLGPNGAVCATRETEIGPILVCAYTDWFGDDPDDGRVLGTAKNINSAVHLFTGKVQA